MLEPFQTHEVFNQSPPFQDVNLFTTDTALLEAVEREGAAAAVPQLQHFGQTCGSAEALEQARLANENPPRLLRFDATGERLDVVEFHPAYHALMAISIGQGLHASAWDHLASGQTKRRAGASVERSAGCYLANQMEAGH
ncbi:MAG TPA: DNA alkylation response protein, partial [Hyphomicrobiaceae bacterium]|nr:DNA alkylation response protein [Hyphomicrobiaceae bacterium]